MKIAVMGMGVAGSYLLSRLKNDHDVTGYERMTEERHDSICAWGSSKNRMAQLCKMSGIDFEKYVIHDGKFMQFRMAYSFLQLRCVLFFHPTESTKNNQTFP